MQKSRFDLQLEEWGLDVGVLKDIAITRNFIACIKECEEEKNKENDAVVTDLFVKKYNDLSYQLPAQSDDDVDCLYFIWEGDIVWFCGKDDGWTIFGQCNNQEIEEDKISPFLAVTLICDTAQVEGIRIQRPESNSQLCHIFDPDLNN